VGDETAGHDERVDHPDDRHAGHGKTVGARTAERDPDPHRCAPLKPDRRRADDGGVRPLDAYPDPATAGASGAGIRFARSRLEHALRASAAQQLRVVAAQRIGDGVAGRRAAAREQAISARLDLLVIECRRNLETPREVSSSAIDQLAARRRQRTDGAHRVTARRA
jgi:hypothetical protein